MNEPATFGAYAAYYDLLYRDNDYRAEAAYLHRRLQAVAPQAQTVLELGCGTGAHAAALAELGYTVHGIDLSTPMVARSFERREALVSVLAERLSFAQGDARSLRLGRRFDVVLSLFHVASYQTTDDELRALFTSARVHLHPQGCFMFDAWHGPGVLADPPAVRIKRMADERFEVLRVAEPVMHPGRHTVDVNFEVWVRERATGQTQTLRECHPMRYFFVPEVQALLAATGFGAVRACAWMGEVAPDASAWQVLFEAQARADAPTAGPGA